MSLDSSLHSSVSEDVIDPSRWWGVQLRYLTLIPLFLLTLVLDQFGVIEIPSILYVLFTAAVGFALFLHGACYVGWWPQKLTWVAITLDSLMIALACVLTGGPRSPFLLVFVVQALGISLRILNREKALRQSGDELKEAYHQLKSSYERLAEASASLANSEKVLEQTEKLSSLGRMAAGVAHELNNPLTMISNYVQMSILQGEQGGLHPELMDRLKKILMGVERITELSRNLTSFARSSPVGKSHIDLNQVLKEALSFTEFEIRRAGITIQTDLSSNLPKIYGTKGALSQVAVNLFLNAKDAISSKKKRGISIRSFQTESGEVAFQVKDSGCGIPREILSKIFDPFFTTKEEGKGTGLGLAIAIKIVNEHGGRIQVESEPGEWTQFTVYLLPSPIELKKEVA